MCSVVTTRHNTNDDDILLVVLLVFVCKIKWIMRAVISQIFPEIPF